MEETNIVDNSIQYGRKKKQVNAKPQSKAEKIEALKSVSFESNDSLVRKKKRALVTKLTKKKKKKKKNNENLFSFDENAPSTILEGLIEVIENGASYLRDSKVSYLAKDDDAVVPAALVSEFALRTGNLIKAETKPIIDKESSIVIKILEIDNQEVRSQSKIPYFQNLTSINPFECYHMSSASDIDHSMKLMEILTPIGKGQRALIVAPPRSGKTVLMEKIVNGISANHPRCRTHGTLNRRETRRSDTLVSYG